MDVLPITIYKGKNYYCVSIIWYLITGWIGKGFICCYDSNEYFIWNPVTIHHLLYSFIVKIIVYSIVTVIYFINR